MKTRDWLTIIGSICVAFGPLIKTHGPTQAWWIVGDIMSAGGIVLAGRALQKADDSSKDAP